MAKMMKAARYYGVHDIRVEEMAIPTITADEVLVKIHAAALCGTDMRIYQYGHFKIPSGTPRVLGHELAGEIVETGRNVTEWKAGDRVATVPNIGCGSCRQCRLGNNQLCPDYEAFGISLDGGFAEYMKVPAAALQRGNLVCVPESLNFEEAVLVEPLSCVYNSWRAVETGPGDTVLIIGAGPIGALHVMMNRLAGAEKVIAADIVPGRLARMAQFGADNVIDSSRKDLEEAVRELTDGEGADVVITACSVPQIQQQALDLAAIGGRINFFGGMPKGKEQVCLNTNRIHYKQLKVMGTTGSTIADYEAAMRLASGGRIHLEPLISRRFSLDAIDQAFAYAASGEGLKTILSLT